MGKVRYVNGWECQSCYELYPTEERAIKCFNNCKKDYKKQKDIPKIQTKLIKGFECINCFKIYSFKTEAEECCNVKYKQYVEAERKYDIIGKYNERNKKKQFAQDKANEQEKK